MTSPVPRPVRTIALLNQKGGVGKTTTTTNLAAAIAEAGRRVLVIDLDPQAHLTLHLGIEPAGPTVYDLLIDPELPSEACVVEARPNLDLVPSVVDLAAAETELAAVPDRNRLLQRRLAALSSRYEFVLFDCPPSLGLLTLNALCAAREIFVPMQAHFLALQGVGKLLETVGLVSRSVNPTLRVTGIVLCMHEQQTTHHREVVADLDAFFEQARGTDVPWSTCRVLRPAIRRNIKLAEAPSYGKTIFDYEPWCPGAVDYRKLAERVVGDWDAMLARRERTVEITTVSDAVAGTTSSRGAGAGAAN
ncbi:MAG: ParA family protein [Phycisphaerales bacterium]|nr:ParA family protein [Phycisphaerales bacterium]